MAEISKITLPDGSTYDLKDAHARDLIDSLSSSTEFLGVTTTEIYDGSTTNVVKINGVDKAAIKGAIVTYGSKEFIWNGSAWQEFGDLGALGTLAYKNAVSVSTKATGSVSQPTFTGQTSNVTIIATDNSSGNYQPSGTVSQPTFNGESMESSGTFTPNGSVTFTNANQTATVTKAATGVTTYTPEGSCTGTDVDLNTTTVNSITAVGTLPTYTVSGETLTLTQGTLPTKGSNTTVATSVKSITQPTFTGTGVRLVTGNISVPSSATFTGTEANITVTGTTTGSVSQPTFTGTKVQIAGSTIASGTVSQPIFTGDDVSGTVTYSPS